MAPVRPSTVRFLRFALALVLAADIAVVAVDAARPGPEDGDEDIAADAPAAPLSTSTSTSTTSTTAPVVSADAVTTVPATPTTARRDATSTSSTTTPPPTSPPVTSPPVTAPPPPVNTARVLVQNDYPGILDVSINLGFLQMAGGARQEVIVLADLGETSGDPVAPGTDLVTVSIPPTFGSPDAGCGSSSLSQLFAPGGSYVLRIFPSGTCNLLGGSQKPTFRVTVR